LSAICGSLYFTAKLWFLRPDSRHDFAPLFLLDFAAHYLLEVIRETLGGLKLGFD
jgi:hypothetical protein